MNQPEISVTSYTETIKDIQSENQTIENVCLFERKIFINEKKIFFLLFSQSIQVQIFRLKNDLNNVYYKLLLLS